MEPAISVRDLSKVYRIPESPFAPLLERLPWNDRPRHRDVHALQHITFDVRPGTTMGLVGGNGAGKSTLLKILSGTTFPSAGGYTIRGRVASLLELGAGFHMEFTGRENIYMNAAMMGLSRKETQRKYDEILDFSELHEFIDAPIRTYSSGMICRLGFSVAVATDPDVLIIDEILAVGDMHFQRKCIERIWKFKEQGKTLFFCSHSVYDVRQICDSAIWMKDGRIELLADAVTVTNEYATYQESLAGTRRMPALDQEDPAPVEAEPVGEDHPHIVRAALVDARTGEERNVFQPGEDVGVRVHVKNGVRPEPLTLAIGVCRPDGFILFAHTTQMDGVRIEFEEGFVTLVIPEIRLLSGEYLVPLWLMDETGVHRFHELPCPANLVIQNRTKELGIFRHAHSWRVEPAKAASMSVREEPGR